MGGSRSTVLPCVLTPACTLCLPAAGLGLGQTRHTAPLPDGEPHRKGISCERTFKPMHSKSDLEAMVGVPLEEWRP